MTNKKKLKAKRQNKSLGNKAIRRVQKNINKGNNAKPTRKFLNDNRYYNIKNGVTDIPEFYKEGVGKAQKGDRNKKYAKEYADEIEREYFEEKLKRVEKGEYDGE